MYIWRAAFGSSAICAFELYFKATKNAKGEIKYPDSESRARFCNPVLRNARVFYKDPEGKSDKVTVHTPGSAVRYYATWHCAHRFHSRASTVPALSLDQSPCISTPPMDLFASLAWTPKAVPAPATTRTHIPSVLSA